MPTSIVLDPEANVAQADVVFLHFLLNYFHRALQPLLRKVLACTFCDEIIKTTCIVWSIIMIKKILLSPFFP